jgi:hypothetical protein
MVSHDKGLVLENSVGVHLFEQRLPATRRERQGELQERLVETGS